MIADSASTGVTWATGVLAFFTAVMAWQTRRAANKSASALELAQKEFSASLQPLLVPVVERAYRDAVSFVSLDYLRSMQVGIGADAICWQEGSEEDKRDDLAVIWAVVPLRNIGPGTALFPASREVAIFESHVFGGINAPGLPTARVVGPNEVIDVVFHAPRRRGAVPETFPIASRGDGLGVLATAVLRYTDVSGEATTVSKVTYTKRSTTPVSVLDDAAVEFTFPSGVGE